MKDATRLSRIEIEGIENLIDELELAMHEKNFSKAHKIKNRIYRIWKDYKNKVSKIESALTLSGLKIDVIHTLKDQKDTLEFLRESIENEKTKLNLLNEIYHIIQIQEIPLIQIIPGWNTHIERRKEWQK